MDYTPVIRIVKSKTKVKAYGDDVILEALQEVEQTIKNYCHLSEVPAELYFTWGNMSVDLINYTDEVNTNTEDVPAEDIDPALVSDIKIGDVSLKIGSGSSLNARTKALKSHAAHLDEIVMNFKQQLNLFRRIW